MTSIVTSLGMQNPNFDFYFSIHTFNYKLCMNLCILGPVQIICDV